MLNTSAPGGSVWDSTRLREISTNASDTDDLPPFAALTTDEERERKAERATPGTYNVIVSPESFQHLPAYSNDPSSIPLRRVSLVTSTESSHRQNFYPDAHGLDDPDVIILSRFEDFPRKKSRSPTSPQRSPSEVDVPDLYLVAMEDTADVMLWKTVMPWNAWTLEDTVMPWNT
jgi:hypothetical protein